MVSVFQRRTPGGDVSEDNSKYTPMPAGIDRPELLTLPAKTDVKLRCEGVTSNNTEITGESQYYLVDV